MLWELRNVSEDGPSGLDLSLFGSGTYVLAVYNNTFYKNRGTQGNSLHFNGIFRTFLFNNIFWTSQPSPEPEIFFENTPVQNCEMYNSTVIGGMAGINMSAGYPMSFANIYSTYPEFADSLNANNLELSQISPAIDQGESTTPATHPSIYFNTDLKGNPRIYGSEVDVGAYEYHPLSPLAFSYVTPDTIACLGDSLTLKALSDDLFMYDWYKDGVLQFSGYQDKYYISPLEDGSVGSYKAALYNASDTIWSSTIDDSLYLQSWSLPEPYLGNDTIIHGSDSILLQPGSFESYVWSNESIASEIYGKAPDTVWVTVTNEHECAASDTLIIYLDPELFINSAGRSVKLSLYPNPVEEELCLEPSSDLQLPYRLSIYAENGTLVWTDAIHSKGVQRITVIDKLKPGTYLLLLQSESQTGKSTFIVK